MQTTELERLRKEITDAITAAGKATFHLGELLLEAKEAHEDTPSFLQWVDENFSIKKVWAYRLMKVAQTFKGQEWAGVSVQVLYNLQAQANEQQLEEARQMAATGSLNHRSLSALLEPAKAAKQEQEQPTAKQAEAAAANLIADAVLPNTEIKMPEKVEVKENEPDSNFSQIIEDLRQQLAYMQAANQELASKLMEASKPKISSSSAPMLPQFSSSCYYARLGLAAEDSKDKAKILEAFKSLCKAGYGRQHEAFASIDEARHELIKVCGSI